MLKLIIRVSTNKDVRVTIKLQTPTLKHLKQSVSKILARRKV